MLRLLRGPLAALAGLALLAAPGAMAQTPRTVFVDPGFTGASDGSTAAPFATLAEGLAAALAGDTVEARRGTYQEPPLVVPAGVALRTEEGPTFTTLVSDLAAGETGLTLEDGAMLIGLTVVTAGVDAAAIGVPPGAVTVLSNCVVADSATGLRVGAAAGAGVLNCTFVNNATHIDALADAVLSPLRNNIFDRGVTGVRLGPGVQLDNAYNAFNRVDTPYDGAAPDATDLESNPAFVNPAARNYHLQGDSNLRDAGDPNPESNDRDGSRNDIGSDGGPRGALDVTPPIPVAEVDVTPADGAPPAVATFVGISSADEFGIERWEWDFDLRDGFTVDATDFRAATTYAAPGRYLATLRVTDGSGLRSSATFPVAVGAPPAVDVSVTPGMGTAPLSTAFSATPGTPGGFTFAWDFDGDAQPDSSAAAPGNTFAQPGLARVVLTATAPDGAFNTQARFVTVSQFDTRPETITRYNPDTGASFVVNDESSPALGLGAALPPMAFHAPFDFGGAVLPTDAVAPAPPGGPLALFEVAPQSLRLRLPGTFQVLVPGAFQASELGLFVFDPGAQAWDDAGFTRVRAISGGAAGPTLVTFDAPFTGLFAVTARAGLPGEEPSPLDQLRGILALLRATLALFNDPCFIATAAYGTPLAPELAPLRTWRDETLLRHHAGAAVVDAYYSLSPAVAREVATRPWLAAMVRGTLHGVRSAPAALGGLALLATALALLTRQARRRVPGHPRSPR